MIPVSKLMKVVSVIMWVAVIIGFYEFIKWIL